MRTFTGFSDMVKFKKLVDSVDCSEMIGFKGKLVINLKSGKKIISKGLHRETHFNNKYGFIIKLEGDIFDRLETVNACYAVGVAIESFKSKGADINSKDYYIIASKVDQSKLRSVGLIFTDSKLKEFNTIERTLKPIEESIFRTLQNEFIKVKQDESGSVYELKNNGFKKYYESIN